MSDKDIEVESNYSENWKELVENPDGSINKEQIKKELADFSLMLREVPIVYMEVTGGLLSKPNYFADSVISAYSDRQERLVDEAIEDYKENLETTTLFAIRGKVSGGYIKDNGAFDLLSLNDWGYITHIDKKVVQTLLDEIKSGIHRLSEEVKPENLEIVQLNITATVVEGK